MNEIDVRSSRRSAPCARGVTLSRGARAPLSALAMLAALASGCDDRPAPLTCGSAAGDAGAPSVPIEPGTGLALETDAVSWTTSVVEAWRAGGSELDCPRIALASGDAALRRVGDYAVVLNRGSAGSLLFVDGRLAPAGQVSVGDCGPHDVQPLDDGRLLVTCFERSTMAVVDPVAGTVEDGPDLSAFADADGIPEMDQLARVGDRIYVSLELLDRNDPMWAPAPHGLVVALDAATLELVDLDPATAGVQGLDVCTQPYTDFSLAPDGRLYLGCSGVFGAADTSAVVAIGPDGTVVTVADGPTLAGQLAELHLDAAGVPYVVTSYPYTMAFEPPDEMRLARVGAGGLEVLYSSPGSSLGGFAFGPDGRIFVANRSLDASAGIYTVEPGAAGASGPLATTLPPVDLAIF